MSGGKGATYTLKCTHDHAFQNLVMYFIFLMDSVDVSITVFVIPSSMIQSTDAVLPFSLGLTTVS